MNSRLLTLFLFATGVVGAEEPKPDAESIEFFERRVRPVLAEHCYSCHGPEKQKAGLRLDSRAAVLVGTDDGPVVVPGKPETSALIAVIRHEGEYPMPSKEPKLADDDIAALAEWVQRGLPWPEDAAPIPVKPSPETVAENHWSLQPLASPAIPAVRDTDWPKTSVDRFILAKLEEHALAPAADADRRALIRRATFDLIGLPPSPEEVEAFVNDRSSQAFAIVVDRLLASPRYGERWGRHWLDLARYSDTAGDSADFPVPDAWRYRNYVIDAFNHDKPYDRFIREQLAGDLLPYDNTTDRAENIIATGFIALARRFGNGGQSGHLAIEDVIDTTSQSLLGLTVACARCHNHKFDPITTKDYYALYGIFDSTVFPFAGAELLPGPRNLVPLDADGKPSAEMIAALADLDRRRRTLGEERWNAQKLDGEEAQQKLAAINTKIEELRDDTEALFTRWPSRGQLAYAVSEGRPKDARVQIRGQPDKLGDQVPRRFLSILGGAPAAPKDRSGRLELAEAILDPKNPLTARVMANRLWQYHFGAGLVRTPSDFGLRGTPPTHPELLDFLATRFVADGWSIKTMHRLLMTSRVYQLSTVQSAEAARLDPANHLFGRFSLQRLDAEAVRDTLLALSGQLDETVPGPHPFPPERNWNFNQHDNFVADYPSRHRSVYLMQQRLRRNPVLAVFDGADTNATMAQRDETTTPLQALFLLNNPFVHEQAEAFGRRIYAAAATDDARIAQAYAWAFGRLPAPEESASCDEFLRVFRDRRGADPTTEDQVWAAFARVLFGSNELIYLN